MNFRIILYTLGWVLNFEAICMFLPLICGIIYNEPEVKAFIICILICAFFGVILTIKPPKNKTMFAKEGFMAVSLSWIVVSIFGALPFIFSKTIPSFVDALFETVSGFTTTGASVLNDVEILPNSILFWRSFTHWIGGMGVLVLIVALLPLFGGNNMHLIKAESPGPSVSKLVPKVKQTAMILYGLYVTLTLIEFVLLLLGDMNFIEAIVTTFGTAGTGGFGIKNDSLASFSSYSQIILTVFMFIFAVDFSVYYLLIIKRTFKHSISDEVKAYICIIVSAIVLISINCKGYYDTISENIKHSAFQVASIISTTGYSTTDFNIWPEFSKGIILLLMFFGACAGSTAGGFKISRVIILVKTFIKEIRISAHPRSTHKIMMNGRMIEHETLRSVNVFFVAYAMIFAVSFVLICFDKYDFTTNFTAVLTTLSNVGPGLAVVGPQSNFSGFSDVSKLIFIFNMLAGRLEIFPLIVLLSPFTWKK